MAYCEPAPVPAIRVWPKFLAQKGYYPVGSPTWSRAEVFGLGKDNEQAGQARTYDVKRWDDTIIQTIQNVPACGAFAVNTTPNVNNHANVSLSAVSTAGTWTGTTSIDLPTLDAFWVDAAGCAFSNPEAANNGDGNDRIFARCHCNVGNAKNVRVQLLAQGITYTPPSPDPENPSQPVTVWHVIGEQVIEAPGGANSPGFFWAEVNFSSLVSRSLAALFGTQTMQYRWKYRIETLDGFDFQAHEDPTTYVTYQPA